MGRGHCMSARPRALFSKRGGGSAAAAQQRMQACAPRAAAAAAAAGKVCVEPWLRFMASGGAQRALPGVWGGGLWAGARIRVVHALLTPPARCVRAPRGRRRAVDATQHRTLLCVVVCMVYVCVCVCLFGGVHAGRVLGTLRAAWGLAVSTGFRALGDAPLQQSACTTGSQQQQGPAQAGCGPRCACARRARVGLRCFEGWGWGRFLGLFGLASP